MKNSAKSPAVLPQAAQLDEYYLSHVVLISLENTVEIVLYILNFRIFTSSPLHINGRNRKYIVIKDRTREDSDFHEYNFFSDQTLTIGIDICSEERIQEINLMKKAVVCSPVQ